MDKFAKFWDRSDKFVLVPVLFSLFSTMVIASSFLIAANFLPPKLPLFYSLPWGPEQLSSKQQFLLLPALLMLTTLTNTLIASHLHEVQFTLKRILTLSLILINLIILITALKILFIFI